MRPALPACNQCAEQCITARAGASCSRGFGAARLRQVVSRTKPALPLRPLAAGAVWRPWACRSGHRAGARAQPGRRARRHLKTRGAIFQLVIPGECLGGSLPRLAPGTKPTSGRTASRAAKKKPRPSTRRLQRGCPCNSTLRPAWPCARCAMEEARPPLFTMSGEMPRCRISAGRQVRNRTDKRLEVVWTRPDASPCDGRVSPRASSRVSSAWRPTTLASWRTRRGWWRTAGSRAPASRFACASPASARRSR